MGRLILISQTQGPRYIGEYDIPDPYCYEAEGNTVDDIMVVLRRLNLIGQSRPSAWNKALNTYHQIVSNYQLNNLGSFSLLRKD